MVCFAVMIDGYEYKRPGRLRTMTTAIESVEIFMLVFQRKYAMLVRKISHIIMTDYVLTRAFLFNVFDVVFLLRKNSFRDNKKKCLCVIMINYECLYNTI